jgi:hypothetical protein
MTEFSSFIQTHNKSYDSEEEFQHRFSIFSEAYQKINEFNKSGNTFTLAVN